MLEQFSLKRAVVSLSEENDSGSAEKSQLEIYSDVAITAIRKDGEMIFDGVYAKIVDVQQNRLVLHFTHVNHDFRQFAKMAVPQNVEN